MSYLISEHIDKHLYYIIAVFCSAGKPRPQLSAHAQCPDFLQELHMLLDLSMASLPLIPEDLRLNSPMGL